MIEIVANIPPKAKLPVSPINTLAGLMLYGKNPKSANNIMIQKIPIAVSPNTKLMMAYIVNPIIDSPVANPSKPSVKFTALEKPTCQKTMKITYANDSGIATFVNGICMLVEKFTK
ncbi:Uncharacterised protein [Staphylococcus aureus]|nr:Uncharacterised protein [Staphylococcus aureus]CPJ42700.1 Uncharacterised protein [Staphylococcus aureus]CPJ66656.1 Uncharacterised protein [Staphylococcus aureus]CPM75616.1 Uncharacterised protein [Staphylococcus aureus]